MHGRTPSHTPGTLALADALDRSPPLTLLLQRLQESRARLAVVRESLPAALRDEVSAGPLDAAGWSLLVPGGAAASKLRQLLPELQVALRAAGWPELPIRIRMRPAREAPQQARQTIDLLRRGPVR